ncbi:MAG: anthranilate synthase component I [Promethearchaeota archaeon]
MVEFDIHIDSLGRVDDVFGFYQFAASNVASQSPHHVLLESVQDHTKEPLYSFIVLEPDFVLEVRGAEARVHSVATERGDLLQEEAQSHPEDSIKVPPRAFDDRVEYDMPAFDAIKRHFPASKTHFPEIFPRHVFYGGFVGYVGYDVVAPWVGYEPTSPFPDVVLAMATRVLVYSHKSRSLFHVDNTMGDYEPPDPLRRLVEKFNGLSENDRPPSGFELKFGGEANAGRAVGYRDNMTPQRFERMVEEAKDHVFAGDVIQVVVSRKVTKESACPSLEVYRALRRLNPSPYMYHLHLGDYKLVGSSPEPLVTLDGDVASTVPIAGTHKRGTSPEEDRALERELLADEKERAEHVMLVDLARNDLAKISLPGTVETVELMTVRRYKHVMHIVSKVQSRTQFHGIDVLKNVFPAGTLTGAPKLRAMEIIQRLEPDSRGPYGGVVGYFALNGDCDWAIAIRTLFVHGRTYVAQAGAGIVADSDPRAEWRETRNKLASPLKALEAAETYPEATNA